MIIELGNHAQRSQALGEGPSLTTVHIPEADEDGLGGYTHEPGLKPKALRQHLMDSVLDRGGVTSMPEHEVLVSLLHPAWGSWTNHATEKPAWVRAQAHHDGLTPDGRAADIEAFLSEYWGCPSAQEYFGTDNAEELMVKRELGYWTRAGAPGELPSGLELPPATALYVNDGRSISNINDGGGQVGEANTATATGAASLTRSGATWTVNQWAGYRIYAGAAFANIISNTSTALTLDRWYNPATPGGGAASTPGATTTYIIADGGMVSTWFVGLATGANAAAVGDHTLATNGNAEITTAGGGLVRKIAPYAQTSGVATRAFTLTPVFTANSSDSLPVIVTGIGLFASMVVTFGGAGGPMKFETPMNASATLSTSGDQLTVTDTVGGS